MTRRAAALVAGVVVCIGLAGCSQDAAKPPTTTPPVVLPAITGEGPSSTATTATSFLTNTVRHGIPSGERQILGHLGQVQVIFLTPGAEPATEGSDGSLVIPGNVVVPARDYARLFCQDIEMRYVPAPPSEIQLLPIEHLLPIEAAILLPGCLVGQIP
jgi:hypothetical protein